MTTFSNLLPTLVLLAFGACGIAAETPNLSPATLTGNDGRPVTAEPVAPAVPGGVSPTTMVPRVVVSGREPQPIKIQELGRVLVSVQQGSWLKVTDITVYDHWSASYAGQKFDGDFRILTVDGLSYLISCESALVRTDAITMLDARGFANLAIPPRKTPTFLSPGGAAGLAPITNGVGLAFAGGRAFAGLRTVGKIPEDEAQRLAALVGADTLAATVLAAQVPLKALVDAAQAR
jgi:hypothetical protein